MTRALFLLPLLAAVAVLAGCSSSHHAQKRPPVIGPAAVFRWGADRHIAANQMPTGKSVFCGGQGRSSAGAQVPPPGHSVTSSAGITIQTRHDGSVDVRCIPAAPPGHRAAVSQVFTCPWEGGGLEMGTQIRAGCAGLGKGGWRVAAQRPERGVPFVPLDKIRHLIPAVLPPNPPQDCRARGQAMVIITLSDGHVQRYGPCNLPPSIERLRLALWRAGRQQAQL